VTFLSNQKRGGPRGAERTTNRPSLGPWQCGVVGSSPLRSGSKPLDPHIHISRTSAVLPHSLYLKLESRRLIVKMQSYPPTPANTFSPSHNINPTGDGRPTKKARLNHQRGQSGDTTLHRHSSQSEGNGEAEECDVSVGPQKPRTRGISACENCRQRKIKCDNQKPACRSCNQKGANCTYLESGLTSPLYVLTEASMF
jgi:hypothetical protein